MGKPVTEKQSFSPTPTRAMGDKTLTAEELRILMAIAAHDRFGANGTGCYASHPRLAALVGCHPKSLSRSIGTLANSGYIEVKPHPLNGRLRVYHIIYTEFDALYLKAGIGSSPATNDEPIGSDPVTEDYPIGNKDFGKAVNDQRVACVNILGETLDNISRETKIYPVETASSTHPAKKRALERKPSTSVGAILAMVERALKAGMDRSTAQRWFDYLQPIVDDCDDPNWGRAQRLYEEIGAQLESMGAAA
ncbi:helix-turn-helix domain-containing protein [Mesorhizobium australicum]|uniref:helix-turn-helix domain-containing protein n=1 Tax=Mesorhizobium australicum TaxID=536018 RepID=UPI00333AD1F1